MRAAERFGVDAGRDPVDGDVDRVQRVGARDRPVAAGRESARRCATRSPNGYWRGLLAVLQERQRELVDLVFVRRPERLQVRDGVELGEPGGLGLGDDLQVGEVVAAVGRAVGLARRLDRVERLADGPVAERVEVHLEAGRVERGHDLAESRRIDERQAAVVGVVAVPVAVGREHRGGLVLGDAVDHDLRRAELVAGALAPSAATASRRAIMASTCSRPPSRSHHCAPTTWARRVPSASARR